VLKVHILSSKVSQCTLDITQHLRYFNKAKFKIQQRPVTKSFKLNLHCSAGVTTKLHFKPGLLSGHITCLQECCWHQHCGSNWDPWRGSSPLYLGKTRIFHDIVELESPFQDKNLMKVD